MKNTEIFTPNASPTVTYIQRSELKLEEKLTNYLKIPNVIVSLSGPSKSGKTVLIRKVVDENLVIPIIGSGVKSADELWGRALEWMEADTAITFSTSKSSAVGANLHTEGSVGMPWVAKGKIGSKLSSTRTTGETETGSYTSEGLVRVIKEIQNSDFVVLIDDFHYIGKTLQKEIGKQIKVAADAGVKIITASVPHRTDDVVRANAELRGRVSAVDLKYWHQEELKKISKSGFAEFEVELPVNIENRLSSEAFGSPQLMQSICLHLCFELGLVDSCSKPDGVSITEEVIAATLLQTSSVSDFSHLVRCLHRGPRIRGTERKTHDFVDGTNGDVYRAILLAVCENPADLSFSYQDIVKRISRICDNSKDVPMGSSVTNALEKMEEICQREQENAIALTWDGDTLDIVDPYFLFYLRNSDKLSELALSD